MKRIITLLLALWFAVPVFAQFNFPANPTDGQQVTGPGGQLFEWDGTKWIAVSGVPNAYAPLINPVNGQNNYLPIAGPTYTGLMTGPTLQLSNTASTPTLLLSNIGATSIFWGPATTPTATMVSLGGMNLTAGTHFESVGAEWIADAANAHILAIGNGELDLTLDTGLTVGDTFTPTTILKVQPTVVTLSTNTPTTAYIEALNANTTSTGGEAGFRANAGDVNRSLWMRHVNAAYAAAPYIYAGSGYILDDGGLNLWSGRANPFVQVLIDAGTGPLPEARFVNSYVQGLFLPGFGNAVNGSEACSLNPGNGYICGLNYAMVGIAGAAFFDSTSNEWHSDGGTGNGTSMLNVGPGECVSMYNSGPVPGGGVVNWTQIGLWCGSGEAVGHIQNQQDSPVPRVSSGMLVAGSRDTAGWIKDVKDGETTLTFVEDYEGESNCTLTSAGQPNLWFTANQTNKEVTFACVTPWNGERCADGAIVEYHCFGQGDEKTLARARAALRVGTDGARPAAVTTKR